MGKLLIYDPAGTPDTPDVQLSPRPASLRGKVVGIRIDQTWTRFELLSQRLAEKLRTECGVADVRHYRHRAQVGKLSEEDHRERDLFARQVDVVIVGLAA